MMRKLAHKDCSRKGYSQKSCYLIAAVAAVAVEEEEEDDQKNARDIMTIFSQYDYRFFCNRYFKLGGTQNNRVKYNTLPQRYSAMI